MDAKPLIIIHGWSDHAASFKPLAKMLERTLGLKPQVISLADYVTLDDSVDFDDLAAAMQAAWVAARLPTAPGSVNLITHSTGALVFRHWLTQYYPRSPAPIEHVLMLAPANFGSPLAHMGRTVLGRVLRGLGHGRPFEVGEKILKGLELASPYTWELAEKDCFGPITYYGPNHILCTILVGNCGFHGVDALANEVGSDGTVRISTANLSVTQVNIDAMQSGQPPEVSVIQASGQTAFGILSGENHHSITGLHGFSNGHTWELIQRALTVQRKDFTAWCDTLTQLTGSVLSSQAYQNVVCRVVDQYRHDIKGYNLSLQAQYTAEKNFQPMEGSLIDAHHVYADNASFQNWLFNTGKFEDNIAQQAVAMRLCFYPYLNIEHASTQVGFEPLDDQYGSAWHILKAQFSQFVRPNTTLLLQFNVKREQRLRLFSLHQESMTQS